MQNKQCGGNKHSAELSGPFKNQYQAFHLRPNLLLVIILHILFPLHACTTHNARQ